MRHPLLLAVLIAAAVPAVPPAQAEPFASRPFTAAAGPPVLQTPVAAAEPPMPPAAAEPPAVQAPQAAERARLFAALAGATTPEEGRAAEGALWRFWLDGAPSPEVRRLVDEAMARRGSYDYERAETLLDQAVALAPAYAEGFNQRAFIRFLRDDSEGALGDLERTLELEPQHFGALAGLFHVLIRQGRTEAAHDALARAVAIHPFLAEASALPPGRRPPPPGRRIDL